MQAVILCGGFGTRLRPLTDTIPKPMIKVGDRPVLEHLVLLCKKHGVKEIFLAAHYLPEVIKQYFGTGSAWDVQITVSVEPKPLGSAGALKLLQSQLIETACVLNGDAMMAVNMTKMLRFHTNHQASATILTHHSNRSREKIVVDSNNRVNKLLDRQPAEREEQLLSKSGVLVFEPKLLKSIPQAKPYSIEQQWLPQLIETRKDIYGYFSDDYCHDMGTPERLAQVRQDWENGLI